MEEDYEEQEDFSQEDLQAEPTVQTVTEPIENSIEFLRQIVRPDAKQQFSEINKDMVIANLDKKDLKFVRENEELIGMCDYAGWGDAKRSAQRDVDIVLVSSRSKDGFERMIQQSHFRTIKQDVSSTQTVESKKRGMLQI